MSQQVFVAGVGMIPFAKPGASEPYDAMGAAAAVDALADAGVAYPDVQQAYVGYVYGDSTAGQKALYRVGMTGIPVFNVNNNCSTGSTALFLARQAIESGAVDCALALGFEQMAPGALGTHFNDRPTPFDDFNRETDALVGHARRAARDPLLRRRGACAHEEVRHEARDVRAHPREGEPSCDEQSARAVPPGSQRRRGAGLAAVDARRDDAADGLPADLRRGGGRPGLGGFRAPAPPRHDGRRSPRRR